MADNSILTPGCTVDTITPETPKEGIQYLNKDNYLSEFDSDEDKMYARINIDAASNTDLETLGLELSGELLKVLELVDLANTDTINNFKEVLETKLQNVITKDNSKSFISNPSVLNADNTDSSKLLSTKGYVIDKVNACTKKITNLENSTKSLLSGYYTKDEVYKKEDVQKVIENILSTKDYLTQDSKINFKYLPTTSKTPVADSQLTNKKYVDGLIQKHLSGVDPHGFKSLLASKLTNYAVKNDVYSKELTYSKNQLDSILSKEVLGKVLELFGNRFEQINDRFNTLEQSNFVKEDGTVPFKATLKGVDAVEDLDLVTFHQVKELIETKEYTPTWITSGPVETTVGFVEDNSDLPETMSFQEIMDAIFYGKGVSLTVPDSAAVGEVVDIIVCAHGSTSNIDYAEVILNGEIILILSKEDFDNGCITLDSLPITEDTDITFKVYYTNGAVIEDTKHISCVLPVFVGALDHWKLANTVTMDYLKDLELRDVNKTENQFVSPKMPIVFKYKFTDLDKRHLFVVVPNSYPAMESMSTASLNFGMEAFDVIGLPLEVEEGHSELYKIYVYRQPLATINLEVTFNFAKE